MAGLTELARKTFNPHCVRCARRCFPRRTIELGVVKRFLEAVEQKAVGTTVQTRIRHEGETHRVGAGEQFVKICHDELVAMMSFEGDPISSHATSGCAPGVMMVGLQGSEQERPPPPRSPRSLEKQGKKPMLVAADLQRPAAVRQLQVLGGQIGVPVFNLPGESPLAICRARARKPRAPIVDVIVY